MRTLFLALVATLSLASLEPATAHAIDTGTPNGRATGALALDANDFYAGQVAFANATSIQAVFAHVLGGTAGETFTLALYADTPQHVPGDALETATATFAADGWNGAGGLPGWTVAPGVYWVAFEVGANDTLGAGSATGALLDVGAPQPLVRTAFDAGSGYVATTVPLSFGLQLDAVALPEPPIVMLLFVGGALLLSAFRRRDR